MANPSAAGRGAEAVTVQGVNLADTAASQYVYRGGDPIYNGMTLANACAQGDLGTALLLWRKGADVNRQAANGATPLHHASYNGHLPIVKFLIDKGADPDLKTQSKVPDPGDQLHTPLMWATTGGHIAVVHYLIEQGADYKVADARGYTVLHHAVHYDLGDLIWWFVKHLGMDPHAVDLQGHNTAQWAAYKGFLGSLRLLHEEFQVPLDRLDHTGRSSMHWAAKECHAHIVEYLMAKGCSYNIRDSEGKLPIDHADGEMHAYIRMMLRSGTPRPTVSCCADKTHERTLARIVGDQTYRRQFFLSVLAMAFAWFGWSRIFPVVLSFIGIPLCFAFPVVLDAMLWRSGRPLPIKRGTAAFNPSLMMTELARAHDHNMGHLVFTAAVQVLLPYHLFVGSGVAAYARTAYPNLLRLTQISVGAAWLLWLRCIMSQPRSPTDLPPVDYEKATYVPGTFDYTAMQRKSLRSHYCPFTKRIVDGYEFFSTSLDTSVGDGNKISVWLWYVASGLWSGLCCLLTFPSTQSSPPAASPGASPPPACSPARWGRRSPRRCPSDWATSSSSEA
eukprot:TRINITY_DN17320_c0_g1_i1.p1 TRINITY_DN17320_c0_g1~~TRINITY_DN17320_c0_g1_i1.p1  ORF type:complete len:561 (+),score=172.21 TRINITY_DN17320_c0_g1_i1:80-1762(+)